MSSSSLKCRLFFHNDKIVLVLFGLYGLAGGCVAYVWRLSSGDAFSPLYYHMNMPVMLILAFVALSFGKGPDPCGNHHFFHLGGNSRIIVVLPEDALAYTPLASSSFP